VELLLKAVLEGGKEVGEGRGEDLLEVGWERMW